MARRTAGVGREAGTGRGRGRGRRAVGSGESGAAGGATGEARAAAARGGRGSGAGAATRAGAGPADAGAGGTASPGADGVDARRAQWAAALPDLDTRGMAVLGRARRVTLKVRPRIDAVLAAHGLDAGEADVLFTLLRAGPPWRLRPTALYRSLMISSGGLTARLDRLEKAGLVARVAADGDGRSLPVELTEAGRARAEAAFREDMALEAALLAGLDAEEQEQLAALLRKLLLSLGEGE